MIVRKTHRLISGLQWGDAVDLVTDLSGFTTPPGRLLARAGVKVSHVSVAELSANAAAISSSADATVWFVVSLPLEGILVEMMGIVFPGQAPTLYSPPLPIGSGPPLDLPREVAAVSTALIWREGFVTARIGTASTDNLLLPPANRLAESDGNWLLRISQELLVGQVLDSLRNGVEPPPGGTSIEDSPRANWVYPWYVAGSVGLKKKNACPGAFGAVDMSVTVNVNATFAPDDLGTNLRVHMSIWSDASDWDSLRCWLGTGGIGSLILGAITNPLTGLVFGLASLIEVGEIVRKEAGREIGKGRAPGNLTKVSGTDTSVEYEGTIELPPIPYRDLSTTIFTSVGPDGVLITSTTNIGRIIFPPAVHRVTFTPNGGPLIGEWAWNFDCSTRKFGLIYRLPAVLISDEAEVLGQPYAFVPVKVFPTSTAIPPEQWTVYLPFETKVRQSVTVKAGGFVPGQTIHLPFMNRAITIKGHGTEPGQTGMAFIHTSAGIRRFDLGPVAALPRPLIDNMREGMEIYCDTFVVPPTKIEITELKWVEPPPDYNYGHEALRQWQLTVNELPRSASLTLHMSRNDRQIDAAPISLTAAEAGSGSIEVVTDGSTLLRLSHTVTQNPPRVRLTQRWLLPLHVVELPGPARELIRVGGRIAILAGDRLVTLSLNNWTSTDMVVGKATGLAADGDQILMLRSGTTFSLKNGNLYRIPRQPAIAEHGPSRDHRKRSRTTRWLPFSITLSDGRVVAVHGNRVVIAMPLPSALQRKQPASLPE